MPENEIACIFLEIDTGMLTSNQFRREIERPYTNLNDKSAKLAGKTYIMKIAELSKKKKNGRKQETYSRSYFALFSVCL